MDKTKLRIYTWPEKILKKRCRKVEEVDDRIRRLLDEMFLLMKINGGVGLAANQAGLNLRLITIDAQDRIFKLVNPRVIKQEGSVCFMEGCLSFPGLELEIKRRNKIWVSALDKNGQPVELEAEGLLAVIFQHEIDHINGIVFINRVSFWQKLRFFFRLRAIAKKTEMERLGSN